MHAIQTRSSRRSHSQIGMPVAAAISIGLLAAAALGQTAENRPSPPQPRHPMPVQANPDAGSTLGPGPIITIDFPGGTAAAFIRQIQSAAGEGRVNVILPKEAQDVPIPAVNLTNVTAETALSTLAASQSEGGPFAFAVQQLTKPGDTSRTFAVQFQNRGRSPFMAVPGAVQAERRLSRVYSLRNLVEVPEGVPPDPRLVIPVEGVLSALRSAAELELNATRDDAAPGEVVDNPPEFLVHADSGLLIVRGSSNQHKLVESMLVELNNSIAPRRERAVHAAKSKRQNEFERIRLEAELKETEIQVARTHDEVARAEKRLSDVNKLREAGQIPQGAHDDAQAGLQTARHIAQQAIALQEASQARLRVFQAQSDAGSGSPLLGPVPSGSSIKIEYEVRDIEPFHPDLLRFSKTVAPGGWDARSPYPEEGGGSWAVLRAWKTTGRATITATADQHRAIVEYLNSIRRAKAGEPNLPGLNADELIDRASGKKE